MGKRANGEGSIFKRKDGRWVASISLENHKRTYIYCKTQQEAIKALRKAHQLKEQGTLLTEDQTLSQFLTSWLEDTMQFNVRPRTYLRYRELISLHILPTLGTIKLQKLLPQQVQRLYKTKLEEGLAPGTVKNIHRVLHQALGHAIKWSLLSRNICDVVDAPKVPKQERTVFTFEQAQHFLEAVKDDPLEALYVLALTSGMREGELLGLKWEDIDFARNRLQVRRTISRVPRQGFKVSEPKTSKSRRCIVLTTLAVEALKRHRMNQNEARLRDGSAWDNQGWVFCNTIGRPIEVSSLIMRSFRPLLMKAGLPVIRFHNLRHAVATLLLSLGVHAKVVADLLGHSQISLTLDTYSHVLPSLQEDAITLLERALSKQV
jgi:integrase